MNKSKKIISTLGSYSGYKSMTVWSVNLFTNNDFADSNSDGLADGLKHPGAGLIGDYSIVDGQRFLTNDAMVTNGYNFYSGFMIDQSEILIDEEYKINFKIKGDASSTVWYRSGSASYKLSITLSEY